jgi:membrane protein implicated in regulation of membrane protease activity
MSGKGRMSVPRNGEEYNHAYSSIDGPSYMNSEGKYKTNPGWWHLFRFAPYGEGGMPKYAREIIGNFLKEAFLVFGLCVIVGGAASTAAGADLESRGVWLGLIFGAGLFISLAWGYNDRMPRHLTAGATMAEWLIRGNINWLLALLYLAIQLLMATAAGAILYATGSSSIPIIGTPNITWIGGAFGIQLLGTFFIALSVLDQYTTRKGAPRVFSKKDETGEADNAYNSSHKEDIGKRGFLYGMVGFAVVSFSYVKFGLFTFNSSIYFALACGASFLNLAHPTLYAADPWNQFGAVPGAAALFILTDVLAWGLAAGFQALLFWLQNNEPRESGDDSSYGEVANQYSAPQITRGNKPTRRVVKQQQNDDAHLSGHDNAKDW